MKIFVPAAVLAVLIGCAKHEQRPSGLVIPVQRTGPDDSAERLSLLSMARGAAVVDRTGEAMLAVSAIQAIDDDLGSFWMTPPHDLPQSMIIALPARSRIDKIGIRTVEHGVFTANHLSFEGSVDGRRFTPMAIIKSADSGRAQWFSIRPLEVTHLRVTIVDSLLPEHDVRLVSILAQGREVERPHPGDLTGCWTINGREARFARRGPHVIGILEMGASPIRFDGGFDGRIYRLNWIRGNDYGMALITVTPDGQRLSAIEWHEEAIPMFYGDSWFGEKRSCTASIVDNGEVPLGLLQRTGRFSLYGFVPGALASFVRNRNDVRFVAHEFRQPTAAANLEVCRRELEALRQQLQSLGVNVQGIEFVAAGSDNPRQVPVTESMRALYSSVDLEIRR